MCSHKCAYYCSVIIILVLPYRTSDSHVIYRPDVIITIVIPFYLLSLLLEILMLSIKPASLMVVVYASESPDWNCC